MNEQPSEFALVFRVGRRSCALPLAHVVETMRPLPVEPVAGAQAFVRGVALVRGEPLAVVEAGRLLGDEAAAGRRWITLAAGGRRAVLAVDEVLGVRALPPGRVPLPPLLDGAAEGVVVALARLDAELLLVLQASRVVPETVWATPAAEGTAA